MNDKKLLCKDDVVMQSACKQGHSYEVLEETDYVVAVKNEQGRKHYFSKNPKDESYYGNWFVR